MPSYKICSITASDAAASYTGGVLKRQPKVLNMKRRLVLLLVMGVVGCSITVPDVAEPVRGPLDPDKLVECLGVGTILVLGFTALVSFFATLSIIRKGKGPLMGNALVLIVLVPAFVGLFLAAYGFSHDYIYQSYRSWFSGALNPRESGPSFAAAKAANNASYKLWLATLLMTPSYLLAVITMFRRCLRHED